MWAQLLYSKHQHRKEKIELKLLEKSCHKLPYAPTQDLPFFITEDVNLELHMDK